MTTRKKLPKTQEQLDMVDAVEIALSRADWVADKVKEVLADDYDLPDMVETYMSDNWDSMFEEWLETQWDWTKQSNLKSFQDMVKDAIKPTVKELMTDAFKAEMLELVEKNMARILGRAIQKAYKDL